jgi:TfoX/Sxy family transcriptional regulator of competence genes
MMPSFAKSPPELIERFDAIAAEFPVATRRLTFGYPCLYVGGNMVSGLYESSWHVRLSADDRKELEAISGAATFEPMPGRPMTGFTLLPPAIVDDDEAVRNWVRRAVAYGETMPPKAAKRKSKAKTTPKPTSG